VLLESKGRYRYRCSPERRGEGGIDTLLETRIDALQEDKGRGYRYPPGEIRRIDALQEDKDRCSPGGRRGGIDTLLESIREGIRRGSMLLEARGYRYRCSPERRGEGGIDTLLETRIDALQEDKGRGYRYPPGEIRRIDALQEDKGSMLSRRKGRGVSIPSWRA
jgi:hypothetical protein